MLDMWHGTTVQITLSGSRECTPMDTGIDQLTCIPDTCHLALSKDHTQHALLTKINVKLPTT